MQSKTHFHRGFCWSQGADVPVNNFSAFLGMRRHKKLGSENLLKMSNYLKTCSASSSQSTEHLIPDLHPDLLSG